MTFTKRRLFALAILVLASVTYLPWPPSESPAGENDSPSGMHAANSTEPEAGLTPRNRKDLLSASISGSVVDDESCEFTEARPA